MIDGHRITAPGPKLEVEWGSFRIEPYGDKLPRVFITSGGTRIRIEEPQIEALITTLQIASMSLRIDSGQEWDQ